MAFLEGLTYGSQEALPETRTGMPLYSGSSHRLVEWKFKIQSRVRSVNAITDEDIKGQTLTPFISGVIDALSDDALKIAMDMTEEELAAPEAVKTSTDRIEASTARYNIDEARALHPENISSSGVCEIRFRWLRWRI